MRLIETPAYRRFVKFLRPSIKDKSFITANTLKKEIIARASAAKGIIRQKLEVGFHVFKVNLKCL
jgi:hypothetical protein